MFLTPDLKPVFGGTYWPGPNSSKSQIGFEEILAKIVQTWKEQPAKFLASAEEILQRLREFTDEGLKGVGEGAEETLELDLLEDAYLQFNTRYDPVHGGFGRASPLPPSVMPPCGVKPRLLTKPVEQFLPSFRCPSIWRSCCGWVRFRR